MRRGYCVAAAGLLLGWGTPSGPPVVLQVREADGECIVTLAGRRMSDAELLEAARAWRGRRVRLEGAPGGIRFRCIGGAVFTIQRAGVEAVEFGAGRAK